MTSSIETSDRAPASTPPAGPGSVRERAVAMVREGATHAAAAAEFERNQQTIARWCREAGLRPQRGPRLSASQRAELVRRVRAGERRIRVAERFGVSASAVAALCNAAGLDPVHGKRRRERSRLNARIEAYLGARVLAGLGPAETTRCWEAMHALPAERPRTLRAVQRALQRLEDQGRVLRIRRSRGEDHLWTITPG